MCPATSRLVKPNPPVSNQAENRASDTTGNGLSDITAAGSNSTPNGINSSSRVIWCETCSDHWLLGQRYKVAVKRSRQRWERHKKALSLLFDIHLLQHQSTSYRLTYPFVHPRTLLD